MKMSLAKAEYDAVNDLRGLPHASHMLVMCSRPTREGGVLEGSDDAFAELVSSIGEAMADGMLSAGAARTLRSACLIIDPDCADWLGT